MKRRSSYKLTFFDRHGPAGVHALRAAGLGLMVFGFSLLMFFLAGTKFGLEGLSLVAFTLVGAVTLACAAMLFGLFAGEAAANAATYVTTGGSTPYADQFSQEQALVMRRDYAAALALYEQRIAESPSEPRAKIAAADLYATHGENPTRAVELYREVQRAPPSRT